MKFIKSVDRAVFTFFRVLAIALLCLLFILMSLNVILRFYPVFSIGWFDEIVELSFAWMVFATAAVLWRGRMHPKIDFVEILLKNTRCQPVLLAVVEAINILFLSIFTYYGFLLVMTAAATSPIFKIPRKIFYVAMPTAGLYMTILSVIFLAGYLKKIYSFKPTTTQPVEKTI
nr:TRAP transporter small permease subunit [uncultured Cohaesibacter sp.]